MLIPLPQKFSIQPIIAQVQSLGTFKRLDLNTPSGSFFSDEWLVKSQFKGTPIGDVLESLGPIGQARLLCLESAESYTAHADPDDRIHLAIITNPYSFLVDITDNCMHHLPADGQLWYMDTGKIHVASNWGPRARIHLNIRVLLPAYNNTSPGLRIKVVDGDYDWKQLAYTPIMSLINQRIKTGDIFGFQGVSEQELLINTHKPELFTEVFNQIRIAGVNLEVTVPTT